MATTGPRVLVAVFDTDERVGRAVATLLGDGYRDEQILVIAAGEGATAADHLIIARGVTAELAAYYRGEVEAGRPVVAVQRRPGDSREARTALGRHGGSVRVPAPRDPRRTRLKRRRTGDERAPSLVFPSHRWAAAR